MTIAAPSPSISTVSTAVTWMVRPRIPSPIERRFTGGQPHRRSKRAPKPRSSAGNQRLPDTRIPKKSTKSQGLRPVVAVYGYRYYDPVTGRWPSRDPIGERGGINIYAFLSNFSGSYIDYLGLEIIDDRDFFRDPEDDFGPGWDGKDPNVDPLPRLRKKKRPRLPWEPRKRPDVPPNPVIPPIILPEDTLWGSNAIIRYTLKVDPFCIACCLNSSPSSIFSCKEAYATYLKHGRIFNHMVEGYGEGVDRTSDLAEINAKEDAESKIVIPKCYFVSKFEPIIYISFPIRIPSWNPI